MRQRVTVLAFVALSASGGSARADDNRAKMMEEIQSHTINSFWESYMFEQLFTYQLSESCWKRVLDKNQRGISMTVRFARAIAEYMKKHELGDPEGTEAANNNDRVANRPRVKALIDKLKSRFSVKVVAEKVTCDNLALRLLNGYVGSVYEMVDTYRSSWKPRSPRVSFSIILSPSPRVKDISVTVDKAGSRFVITGPSHTEPGEWDTKISTGMKRGGVAISN